MKLSSLQVAVYRNYRGDDDAFARVASQAEREIMQGVEWSGVREIEQALALVRRGLASSDFEREVENNLRLMTVCEKVAAELKAALTV